MDNSDSFTPVEYDPHDPPGLTTSNRRGAHVQHGSRYSPYAARSLTNSKPSTSVASASVMDDTESTRCITDLLDAPQSRGSMKDYGKSQLQAIEWAQMRLVMDSVSVGWLRNLTKDEKSNMETRVTEIISHASVKFSCVLIASTYLKNFVIDALTKDRRRLHTPTSTEVLIFVNPAVIGAHSLHWCNDKRSPLCDEEMRASIPTTTLHMLSATSAATRFAIDRYVDQQLTGTKSTLRYSTHAYAGEQGLITEAMSDSLKKDLHRRPFEANLLDIHHRGLRTLHKMLNLEPPQIPIYIPTTAQELSIPHQIQSTTLPSALSPLAQASGQAPLTMVEPESELSLGEMPCDTEFSSWFSGLEMNFEKPQLDSEASGSGLNYNDLDRPFSLNMTCSVINSECFNDSNDHFISRFLLALAAPTCNARKPCVSSLDSCSLSFVSTDNGVPLRCSRLLLGEGNKPRGLNRHRASCDFYKRSSSLATQKRRERAKEASHAVTDKDEGLALVSLVPPVSVTRDPPPT
ncbi:hypothetical protein DEU56DRAFT_759444 [Suillus clintonianus]|uniref:uncharacterized protein n=1 Tax=Suillus clintonianus TaxID=1904413 RepID=UPI001B885EAF|nr:uncharacterized protein DEU56DRAFT_759444 [Suillus clintonianus]KAG2125116.1 hypothetical protein DEU56DRAFT_759444 [Suillus clintonianus]